MTWIEELPEKLKSSLNSLLDGTERHEETYMKAENASVGQIWVAMAQMNSRLEKMEDMVQAQRKALQEVDGVDADKHLDKNLENSLKNY
ncbi:MAG: hypothetical protein ABEK04_02950 [Candidatus Nanohalobium sp.]